MNFLRSMGVGAQQAKVLPAAIVRTSYRLQPPMTWSTFAATAAPVLRKVAAGAGMPAPQLIVQQKSEHEGCNFFIAPAGSAEVPSYAGVEACMLPGSAHSEVFSGYTWKWADAPGDVAVVVTSTCFDVREGEFEAFVAQFGSESYQLRPHAEECGILWQATFAPSKGKATLLSTFQKGVDGPKRMGPKLRELYAKMGLAQFLTAVPLIETSEHGSYLTPVDCDGLSISA